MVTYSEMRNGRWAGYNAKFILAAVFRSCPRRMQLYVTCAIKNQLTLSIKEKERKIYENVEWLSFF